MGHKKTWGTALFGLLAVAAGLAAGCGSSSADVASSVSDTASDTAGTALAPRSGDDAAMDEPEAMSNESFDDAPTVAVTGESAPSLGGGAVPTQVDPSTLGRDIIYSAELVVAVDDVVSAGQEANRVIANLGGLLFGQETVSDSEARSTYTFRVRPQDFQAALSGLGSIGEVRNQNVSTEDVTGRVVDLESRISTSEASVERLRALLGEAATVEVVAQLEQQLLERETSLELLRGQLRTVRDRVDLATITLTLTEALARPAVGFSTSAYVGHDGGAACPGNYGSANQNDKVTLCFEIFNEGDAPLGDLELTDTVLDIKVDDLTVVYGDPEAQLLPGQSLIYAYETELARTLRLRTRVNASPVTVEGEAINARAVQSNQDYVLTVFEEDGLPSFGDALSGGWSALTTMGQVGLLIVGALIPFFWVPIVVWLLWRWRQSRRATRPPVARQPTAPTTETPVSGTASPTPPPPTAPGDSGTSAGSA